MKIQFEDEVLDRAVAELLKPHEHAFERVGYFVGEVTHNEQTLILSEWLAFEDFHYEISEKAGACIGALGMKMLMTKALQSNKSFLQFHLHEFQKQPEFSFTDLKSLNAIVPALFQFSAANVHGAVIMGSRYFASLIWLRGQRHPLKNQF